MKTLLHICCSNCSLYPVKILRADKQDFTGFWYNPNIHEVDEYELRLASVKQLSDKWDINIIYKEEFTPDDFFNLFNLDIGTPPSPERCKSCYTLRLEKTAQQAKESGFEAFTTTLLISPYQDFEQIILAGQSLADKYKVKFIARDFRPGFREAMNLSKEMGLYRQNYCGCVFSRDERDERKAQRGKQRGKGA